MFPFVLAPSVLTGFPLGLILILPSSLLSLEMESGDGYGNLNRNGDAKPQIWQLVQLKAVAGNWAEELGVLLDFCLRPKAPMNTG